MTKKVYLVTDLGPGDGGKGGVVHKICKMMCAHTIIKVGGAQGSHGVLTSRGEKFAFSQWGCGTFDGIKTHLSSLMVISPEGLLNEADELKYEYGIHNAFDLLTIDQRVLCATPFHGIASRLKELARGNHPRGTIGSGVGETYRMLERFPDLALRAINLSEANLKERLITIREQIQRDLAEIIQADFLPADQAEAQKEIRLLYDDDFLNFVVKRFKELSQRAKIVDPDFLGREILTKDGVAIVESSHGILTDRFYGFSPHTSALRTLPSLTQVMLNDAGFKEQTIKIGVHRAYEYRHGAGPMPTADSTMTESLLPYSHKEENRYQGKIRVGPLDLVLLRYAIEVCGGPNAFDGLAITWFDQIQANGKWLVCDHYSNITDQTFFSPTGEIKVRCGTDEIQLAYQKNLGQQLLGCQPEILTYQLPISKTQDDLYNFCDDVFREKVGVRVRMLSFGPTEREKICK